MDKDIIKQIDPEIQQGMEAAPAEFISGQVNENNLAALRQAMNAGEALPFENPNIDMEEKILFYNNREVKVFIYKPKNMSNHSGAGLIWVHGGGNIAGTAREDDKAIHFIENLRCTVISVDWKLAPEHQHPEGMEDCYAALLWVSENAQNLGINKNKIAIIGESAGGGMAARTVLLNHERKGVDIAFQLLKCPMLDNTHDTPSGRITGYPLWDRSSSLWGWEAYLGKTYGKEATPLQSPARATDLRGLPPTYIYVGAVELFRDESIAYAQQLMKDGVPTELHVVPRMPHGGEVIAPNARVSKTVYNSVLDALKRGLNI